MIEGHYDTFDRAKFTFIESIYDGIGLLVLTYKDTAMI
jgi:hypothetical protein